MIRNSQSRAQGINDICIRMCIYICVIYIYAVRGGALDDALHAVRLSVYTCVLKIT